MSEQSPYKIVPQPDGSWFITIPGERTETQGRFGPVIGMGKSEIVAIIPAGPKSEARARLLAASPRLFAALEEIISRNEIQHWFNLDQARAALAGATDSL